MNELQSAVRVPLDSLHADAVYLCSRLTQGSMNVAQVALTIRQRIDAAKAALTYPPLTPLEVHDLTCMHAGAPWSEDILAELVEVIALYDRLRSEGARPLDPARRSAPPTREPAGSQLEALAKKHGATSYRNRADTQHPAYGFTEAGLLALIAEVRSAAKAEPFVPFQALQEALRLQSPACWCSACDSAANGGMRSRMSLCPSCGDKRCPRSLHHEHDCQYGAAHGQPT